MTVTFKSKNGVEVLIPMIIVLLVIMALMISNDGLKGSVIVGSLIIFIAYLYSNTLYVFTDDSKLKIKSGFLLNKQIDINSIEKVIQTNNPIVSSGMSSDRLQIFYNMHDIVIVYPKRKTEFIESLKTANTNIKFEL